MHQLASLDQSISSLSDTLGRLSGDPDSAERASIAKKLSLLTEARGKILEDPNLLGPDAAAARTLPPPPR